MSKKVNDNIDTESLNISSEEFDRIEAIIGRKPNKLELELFSILWSEHSKYKKLIKWLKVLPCKGEKVVIEAGKENAGAIEIGDDMVCVFKVAAHNHPCAVQPRFGTLTGLRLVTRDIFSLGARPVVSLNSLRFGNSRRDTTRWLFDEVIAGLADYEKGFGIPVVGGEMYFNNSFNSNPIVNFMVIGFTKKENLVTGVAKGKGNLIAVVGSPTTKKGIEQKTVAVEGKTNHVVNEFSLDGVSNVNVEVKLYKLIQALIKRKLAAGIQPVGAQGIVGAVVKMVARGKSGIEMRVDNIPINEKDLSIRDILVSETWGRTLVCFSPENENEIKELAKSINVEFGLLGKVTDNHLFKLYSSKKLLAQLPVEYPDPSDEPPAFDPNSILDKVDPCFYNVEEFEEPDHYPKTIKQLITSLNISSKKWLFKKFEKSLHFDDVSAKFPSDASIIDIRESGQALVATMDCNPLYMTTDPFVGSQIAVAEAARNIVCAGGQPLAVSDCLNFGNPNDPNAFAAFVASVQGITEACNLFKIPVISGSLSFYNQCSVEGQILPVIPTPVIGMIGLLKKAEQHTVLSFKHKGDMIFLVGKSRNDINGSEYLKVFFGKEISAPPVYFPDEELLLQQSVSKMINKGLVRSVHDVSNGGLFFTLLESAIPMEFGFDITSDAEIRKDAFLFGESQSRVVVSVSAEKQDKFVDFMMELEVPFSILGHVTRGEIRIDDESFGFIGDYKKMFENRLKEWQEGAI
ncbi:MAG: phosphoribosylformylglycinamidine synthase subunit PurL [Marinilabiliaceae bacterium]|nr:phosphoribosylformylglycinamidine synthase subunit PurL [Marinilabiliaceae bacterium]